MGFSYGVSNLGKIIGPLGLALIAGSSDLVSPKATIDALFPAFLFLCLLVRSGSADVSDARLRQGRRPRRHANGIKRGACRGVERPVDLLVKPGEC